MPNAYLPRELVHLWSEAIGEDPEQHSTSLTRLLRDQRRLTRFIGENQESMAPATGGVCMYLFGVVARFFDLAGGRMRSATWAQVRQSQAKVQAAAMELLPYDEGFASRLRQVEWRAQPHILDETLMALFEKEKRDDEVDVSDEEALKLFFLIWVAVEVLDGNWRPPKSWQGLTEYSYVHIEPEVADEVTDEPDEDEPGEE